MQSEVFWQVPPPLYQIVRGSKGWDEGKERTGVEQEEPIERSSTGKGTKAIAMAVMDRTTTEERSCMMMLVQAGL